jgi:hypothetical protein
MAVVSSTAAAILAMRPISRQPLSLIRSNTSLRTSVGFLLSASGHLAKTRALLKGPSISMSIADSKSKARVA